MKVLHIQTELFHVGDLAHDLRGPERRGSSLEGPGLSVSVHPAAWSRIARRPGHLYVLERKDGALGTFVDLTGNHTQTLAYLAIDAGFVAPAYVWRVWMTDEEGEPSYFTFDSQQSAEYELPEDERDEDHYIERVAWFQATPKLRHLWSRDFAGQLDLAVVLDMGVLYALEAQTSFDGAWWNETYDPDRLSAPRGVIFRSKLPEWTAHEVDWSEAPDE
jgi:hypothetical protein